MADKLGVGYSLGQPIVLQTVRAIANFVYEVPAVTMNVLHGDIADVYGDTKWQGGFGFINAAVSLTGNSWSCECELRELPGLENAAAIRGFVRRGIDAIWVMGRIKAVFGTWIGINEGEKSILNEGFVAYCKAAGAAIPFLLHDHYLRTSFLFGATLRDVALKRAIATAFYELLLMAPNDLIDYEFRKDHAGAGVTMAGGVIMGQVQYDEEG